MQSLSFFRSSYLLFISTVLIWSCLLVVLPVSVLANQTTDQTTDQTITEGKIPLEDPLGIGSATTSKGIDDPTAMSEWIGSIVKRVIAPIGAIAFLMFVAGGFFWIFSAGNEERVKRGRDIMIWTAIGLIVIFAAYAILTFVIGAIGINADATAAR